MKQNLLKTCLVMLFAVLGMGMSWADDVTFTMGSGKDVSSNEGTTKSGVTITATDGTSNPNNWSGATYVRIQAGGTFVITPGSGITITDVVLNCTSGYEKTWSASIGDAPVVNTTAHTVTWSGEAEEALTLTNTAAAQSRVSNIVVTTYSEGGTTYTVTFNAGTGTCDVASLTESSAGAGITLPSCTPSLSNYTFVGWSTKNNPSSADAGEAGDNYKPKSDCTLYAYYTITLPVYSGSYVDFDLTTDNTETATEEEMTWVNANVCIAAEKAEAATKTNNYYPGTGNPPYTSTRFYKNSTLTFTPVAGARISGIVFTTTSDGYATVFGSSAWTNGTPVVDAANKTVCVTPVDGTQAVSVVLNNTTGGTKFRVYYTAPAPVYTEKSLPVIAVGEYEGYPGNFATFSNEKDVFIPFMDDSEAYTTYVYTVFTDGEELLLEGAESALTYEDAETGFSGYYIPANTGVLLMVEFEEGAETNVPYYEMENVEVNDLTEDNMLRPASALMTGDYKFYKLAYDDYEAKTGLGFYYGEENGAAFTAKPGGAYLAVPTGVASNVRGFSFGDVATAIQAATVKTESSIYNLQGQRVGRLQQGVNIVNGKKVVR